MIAFFVENSHWIWIVVGLVLIASEVFGGAGYLLVAGTSALLMAALVYLEPTLSLTWQLSLFTLTALVGSALWTRYFNEKGAESQNPTLGVHGAEYIGRVLTLSSPIVDGEGQIRLGDANWRLKATGALELAPGEKVKVTAVKGNQLIIKSVDHIESVGK